MQFLPIFQFASCYLCILVTVICTILTVSRITPDDRARWFASAVMTMRALSYIPLFIFATRDVSWVASRPIYFTLSGLAFCVLNVAYFHEAIHPGNLRPTTCMKLVGCASLYITAVISCYVFRYYLQGHAGTDMGRTLPHSPAFATFTMLLTLLSIAIPIGLLLWEFFLERHGTKVRRWIAGSLGYELLWFAMCIVTIHFQNAYSEIAFFHTCMLCVAVRTYLELGYRRINPSRKHPNIRYNRSMYDDEPGMAKHTPVASLNSPIAKPIQIQKDSPNASELHHYFLWQFEQNKLWRDAGLTADGLAQYFHVSKATMLNTMHEHVNYTFHQFVDRYRVHDLMELLENEECHTFEEAASVAGFASTSLAASAFLVVMGMNYKEWLRTLEVESRE